MADNRFYDRLDTPNGRQGEEALRIVSPDGGRFRFEISRFSENDPPGKYFIKPLEIRKATDAEIKRALLKDELLRIIAEDNDLKTPPDRLKRIYLDTALFTNPFGFAFDIATVLKDPRQSPPGLTSEVELSEARLQDFGDLVLMNVRQRRHNKNPQENLDRAVVQRIGYLFKRTNGDWRIANVQRTLIERERKPVKIDAQKLDALTGVYESEKKSETLTITRENNVLYGKFAEGEKFELIPESENVFYADSFISIAFIRSGNSAVSQAVVHYPMPEDRMVIQPKIR